MTSASLTATTRNTQAVVASASLRRRRENLALSTTAVILFLLFWELSVHLKWVNPLFTSSPSRIIRAMIGMIRDGSIWIDILVSAEEFALGFSLAILVGVPLGILMGWYRRFEAVLDPFVNALYATPRIALMPLVIIWFGIGLEARTVIIFLSTVFPILINTMTGVRTMDRDFIKVARSFGASDGQLFLTVAVPSSVPNLLTGLRLGIAQALIAIVVGEMYGASAGVGYLIQLAGSTFETDKVMVGLIVIAGAGIALTKVLKMIEARFERWRADGRR